MKMRKILLFTDSLGPGGAQRQLVGLAMFLAQVGYDVKVCTYHDISFYKSILDENNISNELISGARNTRTRIMAVYKYFYNENPDWVIAYQETPALIASIANLLDRRYRVIVSERNTTQKMTLKEYVRFFLYRWVEAIVPNSYTQAKFLHSHYPWMLPKIKTITNFVDINKFHPVKRQRRQIPEILVVGSIADSKNTKGFVKACKILAEKGIRFHATWYGWYDKPTSYMYETKDLISQLNLESIIDLKNKILDISPIYQVADYFCIPSFYEGTPNVLCEAISSGLPVVSSNICDNALYVQDGVNGYLFDPSDVYSIADSIERLLMIDEQTYSSFCKNSRRIAEEKLSPETFLLKYRAIIDA